MLQRLNFISLHELRMTSGATKMARYISRSLMLAGLTFWVGGLSAIAQTAAPATIVAASSATSSLATTPGNVLPPLGQAEPYLPEVTSPEAAQESDIRLILKRGKRRVYVYQGEKEVSSYPVAIGKPGWETPLGKFEVLSMEEHPTFKSFKSGRVIPPGPDNPLGVRWVGIWTDGKTQLGFHGTNEPELIGQAVSHGCIRMYNKDVTKLFQQVKMGTQVTIVP
jgi:lipoprotein-anchoring transpeptidase ErfK/SrfK